MTAPQVGATSALPPVVDLSNDNDAWEALDEMEGRTADKGKEKETRPDWLPEGMEPVLEELPKWELLAEILLEIESEIIRQQMSQKPSNQRTLHS